MWVHCRRGPWDTALVQIQLQSSAMPWQNNSQFPAQLYGILVFMHETLPSKIYLVVFSPVTRTYSSMLLADPFYLSKAFDSYIIQSNLKLTKLVFPWLWRVPAALGEL